MIVLRFQEIVLLTTLIALSLITTSLRGQVISDETDQEPDVSYAPNPAYPHGRLNPLAPRETAQFAFMIGEFDCIDEVRRPDGSKRRFRAILECPLFP